MWSNKKQDKPPPAAPGLKNVQMNQSLKPAPAPWEGTTKTNKDAMLQTEATSERAPSRLGSSLYLKGEISGNEDLDIDGTAEGLVHIDEQKLTVGATARLTADIIAGEVVRNREG
jgi:Polymer-forming cytoskeletal